MVVMQVILLMQLLQQQLFSALEVEDNIADCGDLLRIICAIYISSKCVVKSLATAIRNCLLLDTTIVLLFFSTSPSLTASFLVVGFVPVCRGRTTAAHSGERARQVLAAGAP